MTNINLSTADFEVRHDGAFVRIKFSDVIGQSATIIFASQLLFQLITDLIRLSKNAEVRENIPAFSKTESPTTFIPLPLTLLVKNFGGNRDEETGHLQLLVRDHEAREALISFSPEDAERLFQLLLETQRFAVPDSDVN